MELQFEKKQLECMRLLSCQSQYTEQTQEVRLPDSMPDVGKVLGAWGQVLLRSKEWRGGEAIASGGVMAWLLYAPEDGSEARCMEAWIPFQLKWDVSDTGRDGKMLISCLLQGVEGRSVSSRKLVVRAGVCATAQIFAPMEAEYYQPEELPEDIQLQHSHYPLRLPKEAGEKPFTMEEELMLPGNCPQLDQLVYYNLQPEVIDRKVMADKVVFRGSVILHILYRGTDGGLYTWNFDIPYSQYAQLDDDYSPEAEVKLAMALTALELERVEDGKLLLKAGLTGQYVVLENCMLDVITDAYGTKSKAEPILTQLQLPMVLDDLHETLRAEGSLSASGGRLADVSFFMECPSRHWGSDSVHMEQPGHFQVLYYDEQNQLAGANVQSMAQWTVGADPDTTVCLSGIPSGMPQGSFTADSAQLRCDIAVDALCFGNQGIPMVQGLQITAPEESAARKPSLILRRAGSQGLWELAKDCATTVEAICQANGLTAEPEDNRLLLIPISG